MTTDQEPITAHKWIIAGTVLTGTIMAVLDSSIVNVALPDMSGTLGVTIAEITWVVKAYILAQVIVMPITGLLASRFGRKRFYMSSVLLFTAASMACGLAHSLASMVIFRVVQGFGGGVLLTVSQAILRESFPPEEQGIAMGLYGLGAVLAPAFGPTLGGWLTELVAVDLLHQCPGGNSQHRPRHALHRGSAVPRADERRSGLAGTRVARCWARRAAADVGRGRAKRLVLVRVHRETGNGGDVRTAALHLARAPSPRASRGSANSAQHL